MKNIVFALTLVVSGLLFHSCKKYEDGPGISFRSAEARVEADWRVKEYTVNGEDQFNYTISDYLECIDGLLVYYSEQYNCQSFKFSFKDNGNWTNEYVESSKVVDYQSSYDYCDDYYDNDVTTYRENGTWKLTDDKKQLEIQTAGVSGTSVFDIIELRENQMKLEGRISGDLVKMTFVK
jgi:hypothetical protein